MLENAWITTDANLSEKPIVNFFEHTKIISLTVPFVEPMFLSKSGTNIHALREGLVCVFGAGAAFGGRQNVLFGSKPNINFPAPTSFSKPLASLGRSKVARQSPFLELRLKMHIHAPLVLNRGLEILWILQP